MDEFPTEEEEFELQYGDDLEVLQELGDIERTPKKSRKSLDFGPTPSGATNSSRRLFEDSFTPITSEQSSTNKRSIEDLFGDIDDILYENQPQSKKHKGDDREADYALLEHILQLRKLSKQRSYPNGVVKQCTNYNSKDNMSYSVPNYPFVAVNNIDGKRVYVRCHSEQFEKEERQRIIQEITLGFNLSDSLQQTWKEAKMLLEKRYETVEESRQKTNIACDTPDKELWVELYKPRKYSELLSDENINRVMLTWMKLWDKVVFRRRPKIKNAKSTEKPTFNMQELCTELDEDGRPHHKVALLCGPPGLGKTTLAHLVARHSGYNVVEVNASDDRNVDAFKTLLENATQMRSVVDEERRPNCLIFDEIDGAPSAAINFLVKFITGAPTKNKKKKREGHVLKRPIICICNDVYTPALRPLRQIAFVVNFPPTSNSRLAERLMEIARKQQVKTDLGAMLALAEKSHNDIRTCLSVLHFFKAQNKPVTLLDIHKAGVGQKDMQKGLFSVWQDIFSVERARDGQQIDSTPRERMEKILNVVNSFGDYEKVAQGVFENYTQIKYKSTDLGPTTQALDWFCFSDVLNKHIYSLQNYSLSGYLPYAFVVWHFVFATRTRQKLQYPNAGYEVRVKTNRQKTIIQELLRGVTPSIRPYVHTTSLILDILPLLSIILVPDFRPINLHLYTEEEKKSLEHVVNVMVDYNLNYIQERTVEGTYVYKLDPNIDEVVSFGPKKTLSYSNKQLIAKEIESVKMHRFETAQPRSTKPVVEESAQPVKADCVERPAKDFFGREIIRKSSPSGGKKEASMEQTKNDIWYQYKEGYSNAVRKEIEISDLK